MARRQPRGGVREGSPGKAYPNRTDLSTALPVTTGPSQEYGQATQLAAAQQAVPMGRPSVAAQPPPAPGIKPGGLPPLYGPSARPGEPVTAGAALGPGPGPESLGMVGQQALAAGDLKALSPYLPAFMGLRRPTPSMTAFLRVLRSGT